MPRALRALALVLGLAGAAGCGVDPGALTPVVDLAADLAAARVRRPTGTVTAGPRAAGGDLSIPFGTRLDWFLDLPPGAALRLDSLAARGGAGGTLEVVVQGEAGEPRRVARLSPARRRRAVSLPIAGLARLTLVARPGRRGGGEGLVVGRPVVAVEQAADDPPAPATRPAPPAEAPHAATNVVLYLVDTLRADRLGCYGYRRPVSPRLDAFAADATLFTDAVAQSSWTRPSVASLFTGLTPLAHGVADAPDRLAEEAWTLAEALRAAGYQAMAAVANPNAAGRFGLGQGFDEYRLLGERRRDAATLTGDAARWLDARDPSRPFLLYLHTIEPHAPYEPPPGMRQRFAPGVPAGPIGSQRHVRDLKAGRLPRDPAVTRQLLDLYDAEVAANDAAFGDLLDALAARDLLDTTVVVFVSDHGEEFWEHGGLEHGKTLHEEVLAVPLVVRFPDLGRGRRVAVPAQHADVMPTLLAYLGLPQPPGLEGRDLVPWAAGRPPAGPAPAVRSYLDRRGHRGAAVTTAAWRYIAMSSPRRATRLYDRRVDRVERHDLGVAHPLRSGLLAGDLRRHAAGLAGRTLGPEAGEITPELARQLAALGYL